MAPLIDPTFCEWDTAQFLAFSANVFADYIYYSHLFPALAALVLGAFVWLRGYRTPLNVTLFLIAIFFSAWSYIDLILWATEKTPYTMFFWSVLIHLDFLIYATTFYFFYYFVYKKGPPLYAQAILFLLFIPILLFAHTHYNLVGFDYSNCDREALEGPLWQYVYLVEIGVTLWIAALGARRFLSSADKSVRKEIVLVTLGVMAFLLAFSWGNIVGSLTFDWDLGQYGLFGMPVFLAFLAYLIVRYRGFGIQILAAQVLVAMSTILVLAILFVRKIENARIITLLTAAALVVLGYMLVRSVKREIEQRQLIEKQEKELELVNQEQESLLHFISHEIKGYLTKSEAGFAAIAEGDYGQISDALKTMSRSALGEVRKGVATVMEILDASNLKKGTVNYAKKQFDLKATVEGVVGELRPSAEEKQIKLEFSASDGSCTVIGDEDKLRHHAVRNLIDNSIKYTFTGGSVRVGLSRTGNTVRFTVEDNGVGITPEDMRRLFTEGGHGKDSLKMNVHSTGYGLYIVKKIVEGHGGRVWAESEGQGKGSRFIVELPAT